MTQGTTVDPPNTDAATVELQIGDVVDGRYGISQRLGRGGMGTVYEAQQIKLQRAVALKVLRPEFASRAMAVKRFEREAKTASSIDHRNVVKVLDFGQLDTGELYYTMELLQGRDLSQVLRDEGPMPWARAGWIFLQVVRAFAAIHDKGIVHRDIKPANCFLLDPKPGDEPDLVKILDFGIANLQDQEKATALTGASDIIGSVRYMAPEQASADHVDARTDIYSLGIMMYELLTGVVPFRESNVFKVMLQHQHEPPVPPRQLVPEVPPGVEAIIMRCIAKHPDARFQSMDEVQAELLVHVDAIPGSGVLRSFFADDRAGASSGAITARASGLAAASAAQASSPGGTGMPVPMVETTPRIGASSFGLAPPPRPAKRSDRRIWVMGLVALLLLVLVGGLGTTLWLERGKRGKTVAKADDPVEQKAADEKAPTEVVQDDEEPAPLQLAPPPEAPYDPFADPFGAPPLRGRGIPRAAVDGAGDEAVEAEAPSDAPEELVPLEELLPAVPWTLAEGSLAGRLRTAEGRALARGRVCAWLVDPRAPVELRRRPKCTEADRKGRFEIQGVVPGLYDVNAFAEGFVPQSLLTTQGYPLVLRPEEAREGVELALEKGGVELRGKVETTTGDPIASASVAVIGTARALAVTDASGAFSLWVAEGEVGLVAWANGYTDVVARGPASEPFELVLRREAILFGKVVDPETRKPVVMARVRAGTQAGGVDPLVYTDDKGEFRIPALAAGTYEPSARTEDAYGRASKPVKLLEGTISAEVVVEARKLVVPTAPAAPEPEVAPVEEGDGSTGGDDTAGATGGETGSETGGPGDATEPETPPPGPDQREATKPKPEPTDRSLRKAFAGKLKRCGTSGTGTIEIKAKYVLDTGKLFQPEVKVTGDAGKDPAVKKCAEGLARQLKLLRRTEPSSFEPMAVTL